jgi:hypothetical protein
MSFAALEVSRKDGRPIFLYKFEGATTLPATGAWNLEEIQPTGNAYASGQHNGIGRTIKFNPDGARMILAGGNYAFAYTLATAWKPSTAVLDAFGLGKSSQSFVGQAWRPDGSKFLLLSQANFSTNCSLIQYTPVAPWATGNANDNGSFSLPAHGAGFGIDFNADGTKLFVGQGNFIREYTLPTPYAALTPTANGVTLDLSSLPAFGQSPVSFEFKSDGTKLFVVKGGNPGIFFSLTLPTPWSLAGATADAYSRSFQPNEFGFTWKPDGTQFYLVNGANGNMREFQVPLSLNIGPYRFTNADSAIVRDGATFNPWPIDHGDVVMTSTLDSKSVELSLARGTDLDSLFSAYPPSQIINVTIYKGHFNDGTAAANFPVEWAGKILDFNFGGNEIKFTLESIQSSMRRPGLRRNYQINCPHDLYGEACRATKVLVNRTAVSVSGRLIQLSSVLTHGVYGPPAFIGGTLEWVRPDGVKEISSILTISSDGLTVSIRGLPRGIVAGTTVSAALGCGRSLDHCVSLHNNVRNFGGQPWIPLENVVSSTSIFY